jgi:DNA (cytosine-5)-methyltransferase 1
MKHGSLFSGIGGFDLAARWMGWDNVFHVEFNPWCRKVLEYHFPDSKSYVDVKQFDGTAWRGHVDIISGGFPCQPYSAAGKRMGKEDERHLWPEMLRIIREAAPTYVVGENVRGLTNWNGGVVFEEVCADLEAAGYEVWTGILPAAGVGAPHRRDRVWFVAANAGRRRGVQGLKEMEPEQPKGEGTNCKGGECNATNADGTGRQKCDVAAEPNESEFGRGYGGEDATNASIKRPQCWQGGTKPKKGPQPNDQFIERRNELRIPNWEMFPTQPPICGGDDGISRELDGITFSKWRNESIKAYGNAIVPQVAFEIFNAIQNTLKK